MYQIRLNLYTIFLCAREMVFSKKNDIHWSLLNNVLLNNELCRFMLSKNKPNNLAVFYYIKIIIISSPASMNRSYYFP
jgi:hypothetical protein